MSDVARPLRDGSKPSPRPQTKSPRAIIQLALDCHSIAKPTAAIKRLDRMTFMSSFLALWSLRSRYADNKGRKANVARDEPTASEKRSQFVLLIGQWKVSDAYWETNARLIRAIGLRRKSVRQKGRPGTLRSTTMSAKKFESCFRELTSCLVTEIGANVPEIQALPR